MVKLFTFLHLKNEIGFDKSDCNKTFTEQSPLYFDSSWGIWNLCWNSPALLKYSPWHLCILLGWQEHGSSGIEGQRVPLWIQCSYKFCLRPWDSEQWRLLFHSKCLPSVTVVDVICNYAECISLKPHVLWLFQSSSGRHWMNVSSSVMLTRLTFTHCMYCVTTVFNHPSVPVPSTTPPLLPSSTSALERACP